MSDSPSNPANPATANPTTKPKFYQKRYVVNRRFQYYFILLIFVVSLLIWALDLVACQIFFQRTVALTEKSGVDLIALNSFITALQHGFPELLLMSLAISMCICWITGLFVSHHIAGPIYRTLRILDQISRGEKVATPVKLRTLDCFPELEAALTDLVAKVQKDLPPGTGTSSSHNEPSVF